MAATQTILSKIPPSDSKLTYAGTSCFKRGQGGTNMARRKRTTSFFITRNLLEWSSSASPMTEQVVECPLLSSPSCTSRYVPVLG